MQGLTASSFMTEVSSMANTGQGGYVFYIKSINGRFVKELVV